MVAERSLEHLRSTAKEDVAALETTVQRLREEESGLLEELAVVRGERDTAMQRLSAVIVDGDAAELRTMALHREADAMRTELQNARHTTQRLQNLLADKDSQLQRAEHQIGDLSSAVEQRTAIVALEGKLTASEESARMAQQHAQQLAELRTELGREAEEARRAASSESALQVAELQRRIDDAAAQLRAADALATQRAAQLEEERTEAAALRLRLRLNETHNTNLQQDLKRLQSLLVQPPPAPPPLSQQQLGGSGRGLLQQAPFSPTRRSGQQLQASFSDLEGMSLASPTFSEDFGPLSFPLSSPPAMGRGQYQQQHASADVTMGNNPKRGFGFPVGNEENTRTTAPAHAAPTDKEADPKAEENERLKKIIKEASAGVLLCMRLLVT